MEIVKREILIESIEFRYNDRENYNFMKKNIYESISTLTRMSGLNFTEEKVNDLVNNMLKKSLRLKHEQKNNESRK
jgi:hypothetical protein